MLALLLPFAVCVVVRPFRDTFANTNAALLLVLAIVAVAISGSRLAGVLSAVAAAAWFDLFLTRPTSGSPSKIARILRQRCCCSPSESA